jgi:hypothetical protein
MGNYNDTYGFRVKSENKDIKLATPYYITIAPGETSKTNIGISTPQSAFDYGTFHEIIIEAYSIDNPNVTIAERQVFIETKGLYVSEINIAVLLLLIFIIILSLIFYIYRRKLFINKYCMKPDKPWEIPEEKQYLDNLLKTDIKKHKEVLQMMKKEYDSSLLWHKYYSKQIVEPKPIKKKKINIENTKTKLLTSLKKTAIKIGLKKETIEKPLTQKQETKKIDTKNKEEETKKQHILSKIKKEQEKQKKSLKLG